MIVACSRIKNGKDYLGRWIEQMDVLADKIVVVDDGSTDSSRIILEIYKSAFSEKLTIIDQLGPTPHAGRDWNYLYNEIKPLSPKWIIGLDVDELFEPKDLGKLKFELDNAQESVRAYSYPFFYMWDDMDHYRTDGDYKDVRAARIFRWYPEIAVPDRPTHVTSYPPDTPLTFSDVRLLHFGYMDPQERQRKYAYYTNRDKDPKLAGAGVSNYEHIIAKPLLEVYKVS
jgi:O-antigen biosynthesis protein